MDSGASRNFLDKDFVNHCNIVTKQSDKVTIELADRHKQHTNSTAMIQELYLGKYRTTGLPSQVIKLQHYNAILGKP